jgi:hypothetical protein
MKYFRRVVGIICRFDRVSCRFSSTRQSELSTAAYDHRNFPLDVTRYLRELKIALLSASSNFESKKNKKIFFFFSAAAWESDFALGNKLTDLDVLWAELPLSNLKMLLEHCTALEKFWYRSGQRTPCCRHPQGSGAGVADAQASAS